MDKKIIISEKQTLLDIAIQETGSLESVFEIAEANGLVVSDILEPGLELKIPGGLIIDTDVFSFFQSNGLFPANGYSDDELQEKFDGIDFWAIEDDFIVQ